MKNKSIDINQRIPLDTLYVALESYLDGDYSNDYVLEQLRLDFDGDNRLKKALRIVNKIVIRSPLKDFIDAHKAELRLALKKRSDRNIILLSLLNSAFPFSFDVLQSFGKYFAVQEIINTETIKKTISNIYGGNRATENGIYSVVPMFLEAGLFDRPQQGLYEFRGPTNITSKITKDIFVESFKVNSALDSFQDYQLMDPYFFFIRK